MQRAFEKYVSVPEKTGVIMVIEKEFGREGAKDWASIASGLADIVKCTFGTGALYHEDVLRAKIAAFRQAGISPMVGGTLTEVAILEAGGYSRSQLGGYLTYAHSLGFTHLEFSDGTIFVPDSSRGDIIKLCVDHGFTVISEVGKKDPKKDALITRERRIELMQADLKHGGADGDHRGAGIGQGDRRHGQRRRSGLR